MKLASLYCNHPHTLERIDFRDGLNVVLAEIRLPENREKDTHNLGKTTLGRLLDFCLLQKRDPKFFLFKHADLFEDFVFYLELVIAPGTRITVARGVRDASKISFKRHLDPIQDFSSLDPDQWDHWKVGFERSRLLLDGYLNLTDIKPWDYRKVLGYFLRSQQDYADVFQLDRFRGPHSDWKPFVAQMLGFDGPLLLELYGLEAEISALHLEEAAVESSLGGSIEDLSKVEGLLLLKSQELDEQRSLVDSFDFRLSDRATTKAVVDDIDVEIAGLNEERYALEYNRRRINEAFADAGVAFDPEEASALLAEVGVLFPDSLRKDFDQLVEFNRKITEERRQYLQEELDELQTSLGRIQTRLDTLGASRAHALSFLRDTDVYSRFKKASNNLVALEAEVLALGRRREGMHRLQALRSALRELEEARERTSQEVEKNVEATNDSSKQSEFTAIRLAFNAIVRHVIDRNALLTVSLNRADHAEFGAEILDESGQSTSADAGFTYRKLLCLAFDLAVLKARLDSAFPHFAFHDGVFEVLDPRKRSLLMEMIREYADGGIQELVTVVNTDMPMTEGGEPAFSTEEVVLLLHDEDESGRLFKMQTW